MLSGKLCSSCNYTQGLDLSQQLLFLAIPPYGVLQYLPKILTVLFPTMFPGFTLLSGPKHSTSVPFSVGAAVTLRVDVKEVASLLANSVPDLALKVSLGPQVEEKVDLWKRLHSLLPFTLQMVNPFMSPETLHLNVKISPGQVGGAAINCPASPPGQKYSHLHVSTFHSHWYAYLQ